MGLRLFFLPNFLGAMFIQGGTFIPDSRVPCCIFKQRNGLAPYIGAKLSCTQKKNWVSKKSHRIVPSKKIPLWFRQKPAASLFSHSAVQWKISQFVWRSLNVYTTPITTIGSQQCLPLSIVQLKGKRCPKPHCLYGVVKIFRLDHSKIEK